MRNRYLGICYACGAYVPARFGRYERRQGSTDPRLRIKCEKCASEHMIGKRNGEMDCRKYLKKGEIYHG